MPERNIDIDKVFNHWIESSDKDFKTMKNLMESGDYNWAMFLGHLVIEKLLKAVYVKVHKKHAIYGHDLLRLTSSLALELDPGKEEWLDKSMENRASLVSSDDIIMELDYSILCNNLQVKNRNTNMESYVVSLDKVGELTIIEKKEPIDTRQ